MVILSSHGSQKDKQWLVTMWKLQNTKCCDDTRLVSYPSHSWFFFFSRSINIFSQVFQRFIDKVLLGLPFIFAYIDDILTAGSSTPKEHQQSIQETFWITLVGRSMLKNAFSVCSQSNSEDIKLTNRYFSSANQNRGHQKFPLPTSIKQLSRFVDIVNYYRHFIPKCSYIQAELT